LTAYDLGTTAAASSHAGVLTGHIIRTNYFDSSRTSGSGAEHSYTGVTTLGKAGNWPDADGYFYDADGKQFAVIGSPVSVLWFGAVGDGVADDTVAIQAAIDAVGSTKNIYFPEGTYVFTQLEFQTYNCFIQGAGRELTKLKTATSGDAITVSRARSGISGMTIEQISGSKQGRGIVGNLTEGGTGGCDYFTCRDVYVKGFDYNLFMKRAVYHTYEDCGFEYGNYGAEFEVLTGIPNGTWFNNAHTFTNVSFNHNTNNGCSWGGLSATFINCDASQCGSVGFYIHGGGGGNNEQAAACKFVGCYIEGTDTGIWFNDGRGSVEECFFAGYEIYSPSGTDYFTAPIRVTSNASQVYIGRNKVWGYWLYKLKLDNGASPVYTVDGLVEAPSHNGYSTDVGSISQLITGEEYQFSGYKTFPASKFALNASTSAASGLSNRVETDNFGSNIQSQAVFRKTATTTNRVTEEPAILVVNNDTPTVGQMSRLAFSATVPSPAQNFNGSIFADIRVSYPTLGANGRDSEMYFGTCDQSVGGSPVDRVVVRKDGDFDPATNNAYDLGDASFVWSNIYSQNAVTVVSDERTKTEIADASLGLGFINALRPVSYKAKIGGVEVVEQGEGDDREQVAVERAGERTHWGLIAQEVKQAVDAAGVDFGGWVLSEKDNPDSKQALRYEQFIAPLIKAVQELSAKVNEQAAEIAALKGA